MRRRLRVVLTLYGITHSLVAFNTNLHADPTPTPRSANSTNPNLKDTDGDGFVDGPDVWNNGIWLIGEDKNGNGVYEKDGTDGIWQTEEDNETDPRDPFSFPPGRRQIIDSDGDKVPDWYEDTNGSGEYDEFDRCDLFDRDTDDDGLSDGVEENFDFSVEDWYWGEAMASTSSRHSDSDGDGLPDGLEMGRTTPIPAATIIRDGEEIPIGGTDLSAQFEVTLGGASIVQNCFIADLDPLSRTDPTHTNTDCDSLLDYEEDTNFNGLQDGSESSAAVGIMNHVGHDHDPCQITLRGLGVIPYTDPDGTPKGGFSRIVYQTTNTLPPTILFDPPGYIKVVEEGPVHIAESKMWIIELEWIQDGPTVLVTIEPSEPEEQKGGPVRGDPRDRNATSGGVTFPVDPMRPTISSEYEPDQKCGDQAVPVVNGLDALVEEDTPCLSKVPEHLISWECITPMPTQNNWALVLDNFISGAALVAHLQNIPPNYPAKVELLTRLLQNFFYVDQSGDLELYKIERQHLLALIYVEVGGLDKRPRDLYQDKLLLLGSAPISKLAYFYSRPFGPHSNISKTRYSKKSGLEPFRDKKVRVYDIIYAGGFSSVPYSRRGDERLLPLKAPSSQNPIGPREDWQRFGKSGGIIESPAWFHLMKPCDGVSGYEKVEGDSTWKVPFRMKSIAELRSQEVWSLISNDPRFASNIRLNEQNTDFVDVLLASAIAAYSLVTGMTMVVGPGLADYSQNRVIRTAEYLSNSYPHPQDHPIIRNYTLNNEHRNDDGAHAKSSEDRLNLKDQYFFRYRENEPPELALDYYAGGSISDIEIAAFSRECED